MTLEAVQPREMLLPMGYTARPGRLEDLPAIVATINACSQAQVGKDEFDVETTRMEWTLPEFNLETSTRVILSPEGQVAGAMEFWDTTKPPVRMWAWARVHPDHENKGIGSYLMSWAHERALQALPECPPEARVVYQVACLQGHQPSEDLFRNLGMRHCRSFYTMRIDMQAAPPQPVVAPGFEIRAMRYPDEFAEVVQTDSDAFQDHWGYVKQPIEQELAQWQHEVDNDPEFDASLWFIAVESSTGRIAGISLCRPKGWSAPDLGWVSSLGVRREYRKLGIGLAVLQHSFGEFWRRGITSVGLGVDATNLTGALRLYERGGMYIERQRDVYETVLRDGVELATVEAGH